jgi:superkiller protein 3
VADPVLTSRPGIVSIHEATSTARRAELRSLHDWARWRTRVVGLAVAALVGTALGPSLPATFAEPSTPAVEQRRQPFSGTDADTEYNRGVRARVAKDWVAAAQAFMSAINYNPAFPEAWNELGYALRNQGRYADSLTAYDEALRLRPDFPEALEYLGEAYVKMGRLDEASRVLDRLRPLDPHRADELAEAIKNGK